MNDREIIAEQILYYRNRASEYDRSTQPPGDPFAEQGIMLEDALDRFRPSGDVLEIACGTGTWTKLLARHAVELTALDASPEMLTLAADKVADPNVRFVEADVFLWEPDRRYDVVFFANWLSHVPPESFEEFWTLVSRALKVDGRVFFLDEREDAWRFEEVIDPSASTVLRRLSDGSEHRVVKIFWEPAELESRLRAIGWSDIEITSTGAFYWGQTTHRRQSTASASGSKD